LETKRRRSRREENNRIRIAQERNRQLENQRKRRVLEASDVGERA